MEQTQAATAPSTTDTPHHGVPATTWPMAPDALVHTMLPIIPKRGLTRTRDLTMAYGRDLVAEDVATLVNGAIGYQPPPLARLRASHHNIARLLATGHRNIEVAALTGYSPTRISLLQRDPAFRELLDYYGDQTGAVFTDIQARLATLGASALEELQDRVDETPEQFTTKDLREVATMALDRSVAPPKGGSGAGPSAGTTSVPTVTINFVAPKDSAPTITIDGAPL